MKRSSNYYRVNQNYRNGDQNYSGNDRSYSQSTAESLYVPDRLVYLDNAATSFPKPPSVAQEMVRAVNEYGGNPGRGSHILSRQAASKINEARELALQIFGGSKAENVIFTHNATEALNMAIFSAMKNGGHILLSDIEHNSVYRPVYALASQGRATFDIYPSVGTPEEIVSGIEKRIKGDTRLVIACHKSNICQVVLPIDEIGRLCASKNIKFIVDASQSAGNSDVSIKRCQAWAICAPGHKGLCGPQGSGLIVLGDRVSASDIFPFYYGGSGISTSENEMPTVLPHRMEAGTLPTPAIAGFCEGMKYIIERGAENIGKHENTLMLLAKEKLLSLKRVKVYLPNDNRGSILLFNVEGMPCKEVGEYLDRQKICVRSGMHCSPLAHRRVGSYNSGGVRASFGAFSQKDDAERLYEALKVLAR